MAKLIVRNVDEVVKRRLELFAARFKQTGLLDGEGLLEMRGQSALPTSFDG